MTRDDIIRMAIDALYLPNEERLAAVARLVALAQAAEREDCAKVCEVIARELDDTTGLVALCTLAIRARSKT